MREIKFRGYCDRDSEWRYGCYVTDGKTHEIVTILEYDKTLYASKIDVESLGQYTGRKDKNGVEIYEGDILHTYAILASDEFGKDGFNVEVKWSGSCWLSNGIMGDLQCSISEVVGNIYEIDEGGKDEN